MHRSRSSAVGGCGKVGIGCLLDVLTFCFLNPTQSIQLLHASQSVAPGHGADGSVVLLHLLPADILEFGTAEI